MLPHRFSLVRKSHLDNGLFLRGLLEEIAVPLETL